MLSVSDIAQLEFSAREGRAIVTFNVSDFVNHARDWAEGSREHAGIIVSDQIPLGELLRRLLRCFSKHEQEGLRNRFIWLHDFK